MFLNSKSFQLKFLVSSTFTTQRKHKNKNLPATLLTAVSETWMRRTSKIISTFFVFNFNFFCFQNQSKKFQLFYTQCLFSLNKSKVCTATTLYSQKILQMIFSKKISFPPQTRRQPSFFNKNITFRDHLQMIPYEHLI